MARNQPFYEPSTTMGEQFVADVHSAQRIWEENPWPSVPLPGKHGRAAKRPQAIGAPVTVAAWASAQPDDAWRPMVLREGAKGEMRFEFLHARVYLWDREEEIPRLWHLIARRTFDAHGQRQDISYVLSNPQQTSSPHDLWRRLADDISSSAAFKMRRDNSDWPTIKFEAGGAGITMSH